MNLEETIFFYTRNDYLIVNNLLCGNMDHLWEVAEISNNDSKGVLKEHEDGERTLDEKSIERYRNRIYEKLDDEAKAKILETARNDISNILRAMKPAKSDRVLYRTMRIRDALPRYNVNEIVEFKMISSTSVAPVSAASVSPHREGEDHDFYRYEITVPKGEPLLELDQFDCDVRNEDGEVLLPPMKCGIKNTRDGDGENCRGIIELEYLEKLPV